MDWTHTKKSVEIRLLIEKMVEPIFDYQFRLILIGDSTVGKSSLLKYFTDGRFAEVNVINQKIGFSSTPKNNQQIHTTAMASSSYQKATLLWSAFQ